MNQMPMYSFIIPTFNEENNIYPLYESLLKVLSGISSPYEIIFVNDGSTDQTGLVLMQLADKDKYIKILELSRNFGHQAALSAGYAHAKGDAIISMDCDLQDTPETILEMINKWRQGFDIVYARRKKREDKLFKKYSAKFYYKLLNKFSEVNIPRDVGDFRLIDKKVLRIINQMPETSKYLRGMVAWVGFKHTFVDFERPERVYGETHYSLRKMIRLAMDGFVGFSFLPLKIGLFLGGLSILFGALFIVYMIGDTIISKIYYPLYKWLVVVLFIFLGFNFILIWILGEYIGRIFDESRKRPYYIIDKKINFNENIDA